MKVRKMHEITIDKNKLIYRIPTAACDRDASYLCYVLRYGSVYFKQTSWTRDETFEFELSESGLYSVQLHTKLNGTKTVSFSHPVRYIERSDEAAYEHFLSSSNEIALPPMLDKPKDCYPYAQLAIISCDSNRDFSSLNNTKLLHKIGNRSLLISSSIDPKLIKNGRLYLSGSYINEKKLIFGREDLTSLSEEPAGCVGSYTSIFVDKGDRRVVFSSDYFGVSKIYCYKNKDLFVAANSYRYLIDILIRIGESLSINKSRIASNFVFLTLQPFHQLHTRTLDIQDVFVLSPLEMVVANESRCEIVKSHLCADLEKPLDVSVANYEEQLVAGIQEIKDNVSACLSHPKFRTVIIDLSGGLDSRMVFSAATNFPQHKSKIKIHTRYSKAEPNDANVALSLNSIYRYGFDDLAPVTSATGGENFWSESFNHNLGVYYSFRPNALKQILPEALRLVGFYGEICARPYYSRKYLNSDLDVESVDEFVLKFFDKHQHTSINSNFDHLENLRKEFCDSLRECPGRSALEKFEYYYLFFRNALHCSDAGRIAFSCPEFGPIQSKSLFFAKHRYFHEHKSVKLQFDAIFKLNPLLACHEYQSEKDNEDHQQLLKAGKLLQSGTLFDCALFKTHFESSDWDDANSRKESGGLQASHEFFQFYRNQTQLRDEWSLAIIKYLVSVGIFSREGLGLDLWLMLNTKSIATISDAVSWNLFNRLASVFFQHRLICSGSPLNDASQQ